MNKILVSAALITFLLSCEKKSETINTDKSASDSLTVAEPGQPIEPSTQQACYINAVGKDSVYISLDDNLGTITGKLRYKNFEKDSSVGDIIGTKNGDTLKLNYTFQSEGTSSDREIFFLKKEGKLIEGIGEHSVDGTADRYTNPAKIKYDGQTLTAADCKGFDKKFIVTP